MKKRQFQVLSSSFADKMPNSKYKSQKKRLGTELKYFRDQFNFNNYLETMLEDYS